MITSGCLSDTGVAHRRYSGPTFLSAPQFDEATRAAMIVLPPTDDGLRIAADHLRRDGIVGLPTETVYGLAARLGSPAAVASVFAAKERPLFDPLIVHLADDTWLERAVDLRSTTDVVRSQVALLARAFWPGPLTLVLPRRPEVADLVTAGLETVAVRVPAHPVARRLLAWLDEPLVAPSANRFGRVSPTSAADVVAELGGVVPYVLDGGPCAIGVESTIVGFSAEGDPIVLRPGGVSREALVGALGVPLVAGSASVRPVSPGQLLSHYAPSVPVSLHDRLAGDLGEVSALLAAGSGARVRCRGPVIVGSSTGDASEAARGLFAALRRLDSEGLPIVAERWPDDTGLGFAINDRLRRAAARRSSGP